MDLFQLICLILLTLALGLAFLLAGYRFFLILLPVWGFFAGFWLGAQAISLLFGEGFLISVTSWVVGFVVGLILAVWSYLFYEIGVLLMGATFGYWLGTAVMYALGFDPGFVVTLVGVFTALAFAALTVLLDVKKHLLVVMTAFGGAGFLLLSILLIFGRITIELIQEGAAPVIAAIREDSFLWFALWLLIGAIGVVIQEKTTEGYLLIFDRQYES